LARHVPEKKKEKKKKSKVTFRETPDYVLAAG
jgi:hypothetical protein